MDLVEKLREAANTIKKEQRIISELIIAVRCANAAAEHGTVGPNHVCIPCRLWKRVTDAMQVIDEVEGI